MSGGEKRKEKGGRRAKLDRQMDVESVAIVFGRLPCDLGHQKLYFWLQANGRQTETGLTSAKPLSL